MHLRITADYNAESGVGEIVGELSDPTRKHIMAKNYGGDFLGIGVVLMCRDPSLKFKRRVRFSKNEKRLYMDIMLDLDEMKSASPETRGRVLIERLAKEVPETVSKYDIPGFNREEFSGDFRAWLNGKENICVQSIR